MCDGDGIAVELAVFVDGAVGLVLVVGLVDVVVELDDVGLVEVDVVGDVFVDVVVEVEGAEAVTVMESTTFVPLL